MDSLPPHTAAAHIRNTNRHTWSRWVSKNKGFYQFVCHPFTISLCNVSSHSSTLALKQFPFASKPPQYLHGGNTVKFLLKQWLTPKRGSSYQHIIKSKTHRRESQSTRLVYWNFTLKRNPKQHNIFNLNIWY